MKTNEPGWVGFLGPCPCPGLPPAGDDRYPGPQWAAWLDGCHSPVRAVVGLAWMLDACGGHVSAGPDDRAPGLVDVRMRADTAGAAMAVDALPDDIGPAVGHWALGDTHGFTLASADLWWAGLDRVDITIRARSAAGPVQVRLTDGPGPATRAVGAGVDGAGLDHLAGAVLGALNRR